MMTLTPKPPSRENTLSFMAGLCAHVGETRSAQGYLLELLAHIAFDSGMEEHRLTPAEKPAAWS